MTYFSYKIEHDFGLAPNPFGGYCTLAVCKPAIRRNKNLAVGDWVFGTGSKKLNKLHRLIFAMEIQEKITLEQYWNDLRFQYKKPILNGSLTQMYGDNFYHRDNKTGQWIQENSAHSLANGEANNDHLRIDTGGVNVLISQHFYYFGDKAVSIPKAYYAICSEGRSMKSVSIPTQIADAFISWIKLKYAPGIYGDPIDWQRHFLK